MRVGWVCPGWEHPHLDCVVGPGIGKIRDRDDEGIILEQDDDVIEEIKDDKTNLLTWELAETLFGMSHLQH